MKHKLIITRTHKDNGFKLGEEVEEFFNIYNAERRTFDIEEKYHEENNRTHPSNEVVKVKLVTIEQQRKAA